MSNPDPKQQFAKNFQELARLASQAAEQTIDDIQKAGDLIVAALQNGNKILACGNGGSAADAQHFVGEFIGRFYLERKPLPAITLSADTSILTAVGNDYGFEKIFSRQIQGLGKAGDVLLALTTSGKSKNIIEAIAVAKQCGLKTIVLTGSDSSEVADSDVCFSVPSTDTPRIQEIHTALLHNICQYMEEKIFNQN